MTVPGLNIALFIDADNAPSGKLGDVLNELNKLGTVNIRRAYGNWASGWLHSWSRLLHEHAIQPIQQFDLIKGKNATDMAMTIDVMDILYSKPVDVYCLMSSDCDFTPLVIRLRGEGKQVIGFGESKSAAPFVSACTHFHYIDPTPVDQAPPSSVGAVVAAPASNDATTAESYAARTPIHPPVFKLTRAELNADTELTTQLIDGVYKSGFPGEWVMLAKVGANLKKLNLKDYGYGKLVDLMSQFSIFEIKKANGHPQVRIKQESIPWSLAVAP